MSVFISTQYITQKCTMSHEIRVTDVVRWQLIPNLRVCYHYFKPVYDHAFMSYNMLVLGRFPTTHEY